MPTPLSILLKAHPNTATDIAYSDTHKRLTVHNCTPDEIAALEAAAEQYSKNYHTFTKIEGTTVKLSGLGALWVAQDLDAADVNFIGRANVKQSKAK